MQKVITFCGASGAEYGFEQVSTGSPWAHQCGVAVFAAPDAYGWRVIRVVELSGRAHDVRPIWALHDAERYGAKCVFLSVCKSANTRQSMIRDLEQGLSPVICAHPAGLALAA